MKIHTMTTGIVALLLAGSLPAQSLRDGETFSSLTVRPIADAHPVLGMDDHVHLAYELLVTNATNLFVTLRQVEALGPDGTAVGTLAGSDLARMTTRYSGGTGPLAPGETAVVFMDVAFAKDAALPDHLDSRLSIGRQSSVDGKPAPFPAAAPFPADISFTGGRVTIGAPARRIAAPLRGKRWLSANGCCDAITSHRGAVMAINGTPNAPERFAIDWVRLDKDGKLYTGDGNKLSSFAFYGDNVHSVADGVVVNTYDSADEQVPLKPATGLNPGSIGGNMMVVDIGGGAFAFYAHLQRGSLRAKIGDRVTKGQVLGLLGNTGNTDAPHLHFHLMDGPVPLYASGLPFVLERFDSEGVMRDGEIDALFAGKSGVVDRRMTGPHVDQLPLNNSVIDMGE